MPESTPPSVLATKRPNPARRHADSDGAASSRTRSRDATEVFVLSRIEAAQSALWRAELTRRFLAFFIAALAIGLVWIAVDQWVFSPGPIGRSLIAAGFCGAVVTYVYLRLWPVMHLRIGEDYAARALERDHPELGHALSSYVSLRRQRAEHPEGQLAQRVVQSVGSSAAAKLRHIDAPPSEATGMAAWWAATIVMIAVVAIYTLASPKNSIQSVARLALPMSSLEAPKRVQITDVSPGHAESLAGRNLEVAATVVNLHDDEPVYFRWESGSPGSEHSSASSAATANETQRQVRLLPSEEDDGPDRFRASIPVSHHAHGTRRYRIVAGDASVGPFRVSIRDTPVVQIREVVYEPPAYTGKPRHTSHTGALRAGDGTRVKLVAAVNRPITRAVIEFNPRKVGRDIQATAGVREMQVAPDGTNVEFAFTLRLRGGAAIALQDYRLRVWDDAGQFNSDPIVYPIEIVEDLPPEITIVVPQQSPVDVPINGVQNFEIHATDIDYGLAEVELEVRRGIDVIARSSLWKEPGGKQGNQVIEYRFQPSRMIVVAGAGARRGAGLNVGDEVEVVAIATDNRFDPNDEKIAPGVSKTQPVRLKITAAVQQPKGQEQEQGGMGEGQQGQGQQGEGQQGEGQQGEGQQGQGQQGEGQQGEGQQGQGQQGEGQQGEGQQGEGQQGEGQQGEGQQGEGQQGEGQQGEGQQGEGQQGGDSPRDGDPADDQQAGDDESGPGDPSSGGESEAADGPSGEQGQPQSESTGPGSGESGNSPDGQSAQPPQDDAEAFERIQEYLKQTQGEPSKDGAQGGGESSDAANSDQNQADEGNSGQPKNGDEQAEPTQTDNPKSGESDSSGEASGQPPGGSGEQGDGAGEKGEGSDERGADPGEGDSGEGESGNEGQGNEGQGSEGQGNEGQGNEGQGNEGQGSEGQSGGGDSADDRRRDGQTGADQSSDDQSGAGQAAEEKPGDRGQENSGQSPEQMAGNEQSSTGDEPHGEDGSSDRDAGGEGASEAGSAGGSDPGRGEDSQGAQGDQAGESSNDAGRSDAGQAGEQGKGSKNKNGESSGDQNSRDSAGGSESGAKAPNSSDSNGSQEQSSPSGTSGQSDRAGDSSTPSDTEADGSESSRGGGGGQSGGGEGTEGAIDDELPDPVDLEYTKAATDMVLDYIDETRTDPDPGLLQRLKWSEQDLRRFRDRWKNVKPIDSGPRTDAATTDEIQEALRSLGMRPGETTQTTRGEAADSLRSLRDSGNRRPAPADVRDVFEAFRRGLGQSTAPKN